ncbi:hypothetical protein EHV15_33370 [Paenibacillus oralis]|uniref:Nucleotidyl transferase domain-containing protein n=1 Tax=Paenibacillus oralis TaxID=2490856 RepID=A0A3P3UAV8_9BACL|nr:sugar phosphate nucleotidyltransferase [Paenibacillus oralis]RRJ67274.1 hypothetical protein EHV15_33370 [Paenibacillus oralis]
MLKIILLCGGKGSRLWPLSYPGRTKPFIPLFESGGKKYSAIQRIWHQLQRSGLSRFACILIGPDQRKILLEQLGDSVPYLVEPSGRGTYPAIVYAAASLNSLNQADEMFLVLPADFYVEDDFFDLLWKLEPSLIRSGAKLALIGTKPTGASERFGYIVTGAKDNSQRCEYMTVERFVEKPLQNEAMALVAQGGWWNCGAAAVTRSTLVHLLEQDGFELDSSMISRRFHELEQISFDYKVLQRTRDIIMLPFEGKWRDLGSWDVWEQVRREQRGREMEERSGRKVTIINETELEVKVEGVDDVLVVVSTAGVLVRRIGRSQELRQMDGD